MNEIETLVCKSLDGNGLNYHVDENGIFEGTICELNGKLNEVSFIIVCGKDYVVIEHTTEVPIAQDTLQAVAEYIARINNLMRSCHFVFDIDAKYVRLRQTVSLPELKADSERFFIGALRSGATAFEMYGEGFLKVNFALQSPKEAFDEVLARFDYDEDDADEDSLEECVTKRSPRRRPWRLLAMTRDDGDCA